MSRTQIRKRKASNVELTTIQKTEYVSETSSIENNSKGVNVPKLIKQEMMDICYENITYEIKNEQPEYNEEFEGEKSNEVLVECEKTEILKYEEIEIFDNELIVDETFNLGYSIQETKNEESVTVKIEHIPIVQQTTIQQVQNSRIIVSEEMNSDSPIMIESTQLALLQQQMTQHVQMLTQNYILTYNHPELHHVSSQLKEYLLNIKFLCEGKDESVFHTINLSASLELLDQWEELLATNNEDVKKMNLHIEETIAKSIRSHQVGNTYIITFPSLMLEKMSSSCAFVYPSLLPKIPYKSPKIAKKQCVYYSESEDYLISMGLEQFMPLVDGKQKCFQKHWSRSKGIAVCRYIQEHMLTHREATKIFDHINFVRHKRPSCNPIKHYFNFGYAPQHVQDVITVGEVLPPNRRPLHELPYQWREFLETKKQCSDLQIPSKIHSYSIELEHDDQKLAIPRLPERNHSKAESKKTVVTSRRETQPVGQGIAISKGTRGFVKGKS